MPLVNHVRGDQVPAAMLNVRTPILRLPLWMVVIWWCVKGCIRLAGFYARHWYVTVPATVLGWLYLRYGWPGPALTLGLPGLLCGVWAWSHWPSFLRLVGLPVWSRLRLWHYRRSWHPAMATACLALTFDGHIVLPVLRRVRCRPGVDELHVRMVTGQIPDDYAAVAERLAHTFGARSVKVIPSGRWDTVVLHAMRGDPLAVTVPALLVPELPELDRLPVGRCEDGTVYHLRLTGTQVLVVGATGSGKGSVLWSIVRALAGGVRAGLVRIWAFDPKGGMELGPGAALFDRFAYRDFTAMADLLEDAVRLAQHRADRLRGLTRQHTPTHADPLVVILVDELAALTAYLTDRHLRDRIKAALSLLLSQGRAVGVHVIAALQDPRKEVLPFRDLFPTRIGLRLAENAQVDLVLGDGARNRGALCDRIPQSTPGVGFVVLDGDPLPMRVRFGHVTDPDITAMTRDYTPTGIREGQPA
ncbi:MAG TPA: cell division protein FtsK [Micromonosporaceae bacterium]|nr:cell division protein FtsK [Micromonosporaceae bacterium]